MSSHASALPGAAAMAYTTDSVGLFLTAWNNVTLLLVAKVNTGVEVQVTPSADWKTDAAPSFVVWPVAIHPAVVLITDQKLTVLSMGFGVGLGTGLGSTCRSGQVVAAA